MNLVCIAGPTAAGKSEIAVSLAQNMGGVIVNADAKQVYKEVPVITGQPSSHAYLHSMYGHLSLTTTYSVYKWLNEVENTIQSFKNIYNSIFLVGGSAMYINALYAGLHWLPSPNEAIYKKAQQLLNLQGRDKFYDFFVAKIPSIKKIHRNDTYRLLRSVAFYLEKGSDLLENFIEQRESLAKKLNGIKLLVILPNKSCLHSNINARFLQMIKSGAIEEVELLLKNNLAHLPHVASICGVNEIACYLEGKISKEQAILLAQQKTRRYAKHQSTWFRNKFPNAVYFSSGLELLKNVNLYA